MLTTTRINAALDAAVPNSVKLSVHDAFSATGANLISGTAKTAGTMNSAANRAKALSASVDITSVPAAGVVRWIGAWDGTTDTTFLGMWPNGGSDKSFQVDITNDRLLCEGHGLVNNDKVALHGGNPGSALVEGTEYFVISVTAADPDHFQLSTSQAGAAIDLASNGQPAATTRLSKLVPETYASGGTHRVSALTINL